MPGAELSVHVVRRVAGEVAAAIVRNEPEFIHAEGKVRLTVYVADGRSRIELHSPRTLVGAGDGGRRVPARLPEDVRWLADSVRQKLIEAAPASATPKQFIIDIHLRGARPSIEITTKS